MFVEFYEEISARSGTNYLRIDTNEKNLVARKLYEKKGYKEVGVVLCILKGMEGVQLVCLEKKISSKIDY